MSTSGPNRTTNGNAQPNADSRFDDLNLLPDWREPLSGWRLACAVSGAIIYHILAFVFLLFAPAPAPYKGPEITLDLRKAVPLYIPRELTQRDPNRGKITHTLDVRSSAPPAPVATVRVPPVAPLPTPVPTPIPVPAPPVVTPPKPVEAPSVQASAPPPPPPAGKPTELPPAPEKPKLALENVGPPAVVPRNTDGRSRVPEIDTSIEGAMRGITPPSVQSDGSVVIGDRDASKLQLLSDPAGVDFKPYLIQVLTAVRNNWLAVIPESARLGRRGRVLVQFIIDRRGRIPKIVIAEESGTLALDRAAIAGVNASVPFPPLPQAYKGGDIRLQMAFTYNLPSR